MDQPEGDQVLARYEDIIRLLDRLNGSQSEVACELKRKLSPHFEGCPVDFDTVVCWPQTPPDSLAIVPCIEQLNGIKYDTRENATRYCHANSSWDQYSNYTTCKELSPLEVPEVELTTTIYFIGYTVSLIALTFAVYIFWKFK